MSGAQMALFGGADHVGSFTAIAFSSFVGVDAVTPFGAWSVQPVVRGAATIIDILDWNGAGPYFAVVLNGILTQDYFAYILINGVFRKTASATFGTGGGVSSWTWSAQQVGLANNVSYPFTIGL